ncbi:caspase family protein [Clostridium perfringens]|uniref:caspase family protein n=1 Tax=Clostridium perfringens TaxID=1502 RepID=UPI001ABBC55A|nr:caspase family protein [Clostridium perfringens]MBO3399099.1 caspase family protein [Clostridium perfringens]
MRKALIVGINNYIHLRELTTCVNDANRISELLSRNENNTLNFDTKLLVDGEASKQKIKYNIERLFNSQAETALLYFSGHGGLDNYGKGYIIHHDAQNITDCISMEWILELANKSKSLNKVIILDCCNSGSMGCNGIIKDNASIIGDGVTIMTSSMGNEPSLESENGEFGLFTNLLISALEGQACDVLGRITLASTYSFIDTALSLWEQRPVFKTNITNFNPIRKVDPLISLNKFQRITEFFETPDSKFKLDPSFEPDAPEPKLIEPIKENTEKFAILQEFNKNGLVKAGGGEIHMYYAAMNSTWCELTETGKRYWQIIKNGRY